MPARQPRRSNCLGVGYSAQRVLRGRGCAELGEFSSARRVPAGRRRADLAGSSPGARGVAGPSGLAASITAFQALSALQLDAVAWPPSHGRTEGEESQGLRAQGRLIASYRTGRRLEVDVAQLRARPIAQAGGVRPPRARAHAPTRWSGTTDLGSGKITGRGLASPAAARRSASGCAGAAVGHGANVRPTQTGSGVRPARKNAVLAAGKRRGGRAERAAVQNRVRVWCGRHQAFDLARTGKLGGGLG